MRWIVPDSGQLEEHLLRRGFFDDHQVAQAAKVAHENEGERDDHEEGDVDHHEEGDVGGEDHHDDEGVNTEAPLMSALRDSHVQDLLLKETSNDRAAAREKAKLAQIEIDGVTPLFPGCRPEDTRLHVTLAALKMKTQNKWTDSSFNKSLQFWHDRLSRGKHIAKLYQRGQESRVPS